MKKLLIILLTFTAFTSSAQVYQRDPAYGRSIDRYEVLKDLGIPTFCGTPTVNSTVTDKAKIAYDSCGHKFYIYDPSNATWGQLTGGTVNLDSVVTHSFMNADSTIKYGLNNKGDTIEVNYYVGGGSGSGTILSVTGSPSGLVDNTDPANPIIQQDASKVNISDTAAMLTPYQKSITLTTTGTSGAATLSGNTLNIPQYSDGGGSSSGVDSTNTATSAGQTVFTFPYTLTDYTVSKQVIRNGVLIDPSDYTVNTGNITFTGFTCDSGDKIKFIGIK